MYVFANSKFAKNLAFDINQDILAYPMNIHLHPNNGRSNDKTPTISDEGLLFWWPTRT
jgi:hypothetical protein